MINIIHIYEGITGDDIPIAMSHPSVSISSSPSAEVAALGVDPCSDVDASAIGLFEAGGAKDCRRSWDTRGRRYILCRTKVARETVLAPLHR